MDSKSKAMKVLISGATGFIGSDLSSLLIDQGYTVHYLTTSKRKIEQKENYKGFLWNPAKNQIDLKCLEGVEAIVNLAGHTINCRSEERRVGKECKSLSEQKE